MTYNVEINNLQESKSKSENEIIKEEYEEENIINNDKKQNRQIDNKKEKEKIIKETNISNKKEEIILIPEIKVISEDTIVYNGKEFKNTKRINRYNQKRKIKKLSINVFI